LLQPCVVNRASTERAVLTWTSASVAMVTPAPAAKQVWIALLYRPTLCLNAILAVGWRPYGLYVILLPCFSKKVTPKCTGREQTPRLSKLSIASRGNSRLHFWL